MTEKITRAMFLRAALACDGGKLTDPDYRAVGEKMLASITAPRTKSGTSVPSKARRDNEQVAEELAAMVDEGQTISIQWVMEHSPYCNGQVVIMSSQKVVGVMNVAQELGYFARGKDGKKVVYTRL